MSGLNLGQYPSNPLAHIDLASAPASGDFESDDFLTIQERKGPVGGDRIPDLRQLIQFDASPIGKNDR